ncbi:DMT family transporter [Alkalihalobacillus sp. AL-G]|uniref:DMT family transporter n=1 Tax=Alkalihalobacillus sp. AL-G TaxID=2926399 RepID=UPI0027296D87|nr:DMT family transporter [Alkalihalobacillus sp. AL-G]WLD94994.1 DMT family transporter [Alkalihalobacillus sp. AL-G]
MKLYASLITLSLIWGMSFLFIKVLVEDIGAWGIVFIRCTFGALTLIGIMLIQRKKIFPKGLPWKTLLVVGLFNAMIPWGLIAISETKISSSLASIVNATTPIWTSVIGVIFFSIHLKYKQWFGVLIGFIGILILINLDINQFFKEDLVGMGTMIAATLCYGFSSQYTKRNLQGLSVMIISLFTLLIGAFGSLSVMLLTGEVITIEAVTEPVSIAAFIGLGVFGSGLAYLLFYYMIQKGSAEFATFVTYLVPITAMLWGHFLLDEYIPPYALYGLVLIFLGVYLSTRKTMRQQTQNVSEVTGR